MKKVLITGINGFVGPYLAEHLQAYGTFEILGTYYTGSNLEKLSKLKNSISVRQLDIAESETVSQLVTEFAPDYIYHLAAQTSPRHSFNNPSEVLMNNILGQLNILEAVKNSKKHDTKLLVVSTGEIYGQVHPEDLPVDENTPLRPVSPYAVSKLAQDYLGLQYYLSYSLQTIRVRPFNHIGPGQDTRLVVASFAKQIAEIEKGKRESVISVGNLETKRDFTDVRDIVRAYVLLMDKGTAGEVYNIGSGVSVKVKDILEKLLSLSKAHPTIQVDQSLLRPSDILEISVNNTKLTTLTSWKPQIPIEKTLADILDYWRKMV